MINVAPAAKMAVLSKTIGLGFSMLLPTLIEHKLISSESSAIIAKAQVVNDIADQLISRVSRLKGSRTIGITSSTRSIMSSINFAIIKAIAKNPGNSWQ